MVSPGLPSEACQKYKALSSKRGTRPCTMRAMDAFPQTHGDVCARFSCKRPKAEPRVPNTMKARGQLLEQTKACKQEHGASLSWGDNETSG